MARISVQATGMARTEGKEMPRWREGGTGPLKLSKLAIADLHFRRVPGGIVKKRSEVCWIQQKTGEGVLKLEGWVCWWPRLWVMPRTWGALEMVEATDLMITWGEGNRG